jgi:hypothetical protein
VDVLGVDLAIDFLLTFGGAELYLSRNPRQSRLTELVGVEKAGELAVVAAANRMHPRIPVARDWLARALSAKGLPVAEIARRLHTTDVSVRRYLAPSQEPRKAPDTRQFTLPL